MNVTGIRSSILNAHPLISCAHLLLYSGRACDGGADVRREKRHCVGGRI